MTQIDFAAARTEALGAIERLAAEQSLGELILIEDRIIETADAWYFPYDSAAFVLRGEISSALAGNIPVRVARDGSGVRFEEPKSA